MTTKMYTVEGMMCDGCVATVRSALKALPEIIEAQVQLTEPQAIVSMREDLASEKLQQAISPQGKYQIREYQEPSSDAVRKNPSGKSRKLFSFLMPKKDCCR